jgi:hypothetical protein
MTGKTLDISTSIIPLVLNITFLPLLNQAISTNGYEFSLLNQAISTMVTNAIPS